MLELRKNLEFRPSFEKGKVLVLKRSCKDYSCKDYRNEEYDQYFDKDRLVTCLGCGFSRYLMDLSKGGKDNSIKLVEEHEWCSIKSDKIDYEGNFDEGKPFVYGAVRAKDLRIATSKDLLDDHKKYQ